MHQRISKKVILSLVIAVMIFGFPGTSEASWFTKLRNRLVKLVKKKQPAKTKAKPVVASNLNTSKASLDAFNSAIKGFWDTVRPTLAPTLTKSLQGLAGKKNKDLTIETISLGALDLNASLKMDIQPIGGGQKLSLDIPNKPGWGITLNATVKYELVKKIWFFTIRKTIRLPLTIYVSNLQARVEVIIDTTNAQYPVAKKANPPVVNFKLKIGSSKPLANLVLKLASPIVTWFLKKEMKKMVLKFLPVLNQTIANKPAPPIGLGGNLAATTSRPDLLKHALKVDENIIKYHLPHGTISSTMFASATSRVPVYYLAYGDSSIWTGHYLAGEAFKYSMLKDAGTLKHIKKLLFAIERLFDVAKPGGGLLCRYAAPLSTPTGQHIIKGLKPGQNHVGTTSHFKTIWKGIPYAAIGHISRDQYCGIMLGLATAYDYVNDVQVKADCLRLLSRAVNYLDQNKWIARRVNPNAPTTISAPFVQTPAQLFNFVQMANHMDPAKFQNMHKKYSPLTSVMWLPAMIGAMETHFKYYGFNLTHATYYSLMRLEKDPQRYQDELRAFLIYRKAVGHHRNAWFDLVTVAVVPAEKAKYTPIIMDDIRRFALRTQREIAIPNPTKTDPTIAKIDYSGLQFNKMGWNLSGVQNLKPTGNKERIAKFPQPVERRPHTDFLWQRSPFELSTNRNLPQYANPGVDMVLPYWMARVYGVIK